MAETIDPKLLDKRTQDRYLKRGLLDEKVLERYLKSLEDASEKGVPVTTRMDDEPSEEDAEQPGSGATA